MKYDDSLEKMKKVSERQIGVDVYLTMKVPNREIMSIYRNQIGGWFAFFT